MKSFFIPSLVLGVSLTTGGFCENCDSSSQHHESVKTDAGSMDFSILDRIKNKAVYQHIHHLDTDNKFIELKDGSRWSVSKVGVLKGWEKNKNLVITQNHALFSTSGYALINFDAKLAEPISMVREPTPHKSTHYVKNIVMVNDILTLNDDSRWVIHSSDRDKLSRIAENHCIIVGVNTGGDRDKAPYLLIDTSNNNSVRAQQLH
jgi:hypothetical protein